MKSSIKYPLSLKFSAIIMLMALIIGLLIVFVAYQLYSTQNFNNYVQQGETLVNESSKYVDWDSIDRYLETGETDEQYEKTLKNLRTFTEAAGAEYAFIVKPTKEGAIYVYDTDESDERLQLGEFLEWYEEFAVQSDAMAAGEPIDPVVTNDEFGWLMSVYIPMYDSSGNFVAYMGVDYSVDQLVNEQFEFIQRLVIVAIIVAVVMTALFVLLLSRSVIRPINKIAYAANDFLIRGEEGEDFEVSSDSIFGLNIRTKDEVQSLSESLKVMVADIDEYIKDLEDANERAASDPMTGLLNRESFRERASSLIVKDHSGDMHIFIMIDLDNFKDINDDCGHNVGDEIILAVAEAIKTKFREDDLIARMGGDEFAVFYKSASGLSEIEARVQRISEAIQNVTVSGSVKVTVSIGVAYCNAKANNSYQDLYMQADEALYEAKAKGRNTYSINKESINQRRRKDD